MRTLDRFSIYALSFAIVALVIALLMQKSRKSGDTGEIAPLPEEYEAFAEHLGGLNDILDKESPLRRSTRLGNKIK